MITEKFDAALNDLGSMAGTVPAEIWERLSPIHAQLRGIQEPLSEMERLGVAPGLVEPMTRLGIAQALEEAEMAFVTCPEDGPHAEEPVSLSMCLKCDNMTDCWRP